MYICRHSGSRSYFIFISFSFVTIVVVAFDANTALLTTDPIPVEPNLNSVNGVEYKTSIVLFVIVVDTSQSKLYSFLKPHFSNFKSLLNIVKSGLKLPDSRDFNQILLQMLKKLLEYIK